MPAGHPAARRSCCWCRPTPPSAWPASAPTRTSTCCSSRRSARGRSSAGKFFAALMLARADLQRLRPVHDVHLPAARHRHADDPVRPGDRPAGDAVRRRCRRCSWRRCPAGGPSSSSSRSSASSGSCSLLLALIGHDVGDDRAAACAAGEPTSSGSSQPVIGRALGCRRAAVLLLRVRMISPPSSNRILPMRSVCWPSGSRHRPGGVFSWRRTVAGPTTGSPILIIWSSLFAQLALCVQFIISICERDQWGRALARPIPNRWWLRCAGLLPLHRVRPTASLFTLILLGLTLGLTSAWLEANAAAARSWHSVERRLIRVRSAWSSAVRYCYGLTAVLVRVYLLANQVRSGFTWLVAMLLVGLGSSMPAVRGLHALPRPDALRQRGGRGGSCPTRSWRWSRSCQRLPRAATTSSRRLPVVPGHLGRAGRLLACRGSSAR